MSLEEEINKARREIFTDGYDMSIGEITNLYKDNELFINPEYQRLFRWSESQKTRFIESLLLGIPIPPIFVMQDESGRWELIDGLQRLSTILEFSALLKDSDGNLCEPSVLSGTKQLPSLSGKRWDDTGGDGIGKTLQIQIKRARLRVEILKKESDPNTKYELFQRLNTGGASLTPQEVRNCVAVMLNPSLHKWMTNLSKHDDFLITTNQTASAIEQQINIELVLRFIAFRHVPYSQGLDVHEYLDHALLTIANNSTFDTQGESSVFFRTFDLLNKSLGESAFKKWDRNASSYGGKFLMSCFEVISIGTSKNIDSICSMDEEEQIRFIKEKSKLLWNEDLFIKNSGAGVRGTTRLANLLPMGADFFRP